MPRSVHRESRQGWHFDNWISEFLPTAQRFVAKVRAYVPIEGETLHQATLPGFPRKRTEREIKKELFHLKRLLVGWDEDVDEQRWGCSQEIANGIVWFANLVSGLVDRWGWGCETSTQGAPADCTTVTVVASELVAMEFAIDMIRPKPEPERASEAGSPLPPFSPQDLAPTKSHSGSDCPPRFGSPPPISPDRKGEWSPCQQDCLAVVRESDKRLTTREVMERLSASGRLHGECTIRTALATLVKLGFLDNRQHPKPGGYGVRVRDEPGIPAVPITVR